MKYVALLRGINVSGKNKIRMVDLRALFQSLGFQNISTYIQSGNVIFDTDDIDSNSICHKIESKIFKEFGYDIKVILRTVKELEEILESNPYLSKENVEKKKLYVAFLNSEPTEESIEKLESYNVGLDKFTVINKEVFILYENNAGRSKLTTNLIEKKLEVYCTARNWRTINKVVELSKN